jgi:hypothetical protein
MSDVHPPGASSPLYDVAPNALRRASATHLHGCRARCRCCSDADRLGTGRLVQHLWRDYPVLINRRPGETRTCTGCPGLHPRRMRDSEGDRGRGGIGWGPAAGFEGSRAHSLNCRRIPQGQVLPGIHRPNCSLPQALRIHDPRTSVPTPWGMARWRSFAFSAKAATGQRGSSSGHAV